MNQHRDLRTAAMWATILGRTEEARALEDEADMRAHIARDPIGFLVSRIDLSEVDIGYELHTEGWLDYLSRTCRASLSAHRKGRNAIDRPPADPNGSVTMRWIPEHTFRSPVSFERDSLTDDRDSARELKAAWARDIHRETGIDVGSDIRIKSEREVWEQVKRQRDEARQMTPTD